MEGSPIERELSSENRQTAWRCATGNSVGIDIEARVTCVSWGYHEESSRRIEVGGNKSIASLGSSPTTSMTPVLQAGHWAGSFPVNSWSCSRTVFGSTSGISGGWPSSSLHRRRSRSLQRLAKNPKWRMRMKDGGRA